MRPATGLGINRCCRPSMLRCSARDLVSSLCLPTNCSTAGFVATDPCQNKKHVMRIDISVKRRGDQSLPEESFCGAEGSNLRANR